MRATGLWCVGAGKEDLWEKRLQERVLYNLEHMLVDCPVFELKNDFFLSNLVAERLKLVPQ